MALTEPERDYLTTQPLGRLATRRSHGVADNGEVAPVIDDLVSRDPWTVRGVEIRGRAGSARRQRPLRRGERS